MSLAPTDGETPKESLPSKDVPSKDVPLKDQPSTTLASMTLPPANRGPHGDAGGEKLALGRIISAIVFALFALAFFAAGVILALTPANQLPGFLGHAGSATHHTLRGVGSLIVGLVFTAAAWFALRYQSLALEEARAADAAQQPAQKRSAAGAKDSQNLPAA